MLFLENFLFLLTLLKISTSATKICQDLPSPCEYISYRELHEMIEDEFFFKKDGLICSNGLENKSVVDFKRFQKDCILSAKRKKPNAEVNIHLSIAIRSPPQWRIVNDSFGVLKLTDFDEFNFNLRFLNSKGFDIDSAIYVKQTWLHFHTDFQLYKHGRLVKSCAEFNDSNSREFIFHELSTTFRNERWVREVHISSPNSIYPTCSLFFRNARLVKFGVSFMVDSFYKKNVIAFIDPLNFDMNRLNSSVFNLMIGEFFDITLDSKFLSPYVFANAGYMKFSGRIKSIDKNVFQPFKRLRSIDFNYDYISMIFRRQGIEWIKNINSNVKVNVSNKTEVDKNKELIVSISFSTNRKLYAHRNTHYLYDRDFCLFLDFPFEQMVFILPNYDERENTFRLNESYSCTELWLFQFYGQADFAYRYRGIEKLTASNFSTCNFNQRFKLCNKTQFLYQSNKEAYFTSFDAILILDLTYIILSSLFSVLAIITNSITIHVILHKNNKQSMREKHYIYMCLHCFANISIASIQLISLLNECQNPIGVYCSIVWQKVPIQYVKIIFGEYFNSVFRLLSNFTYFGFAMTRMSKVGKDHGKFIVFMSETRIKVYMLISMLVSVSLSICKAIQFDINLDYPEYSFPIPYVQNPQRSEWKKLASLVLIFVINIVYNFLNYFLFSFVHLIVDLILLRKLRQVIREKEAKMREMKKSEKEMANAAKENEEAKRRALFMVLANSGANFGTKVPLIITSLNDLRILIQRPYAKIESAIQMQFFSSYIDRFSADFSFSFFCSSVKGCLLFQGFGNCLFLLSLSMHLVFLKKFDKNFKTSYDTLYDKNHKNNKTNE